MPIQALVSHTTAMTLLQSTDYASHIGPRDACLPLLIHLTTNNSVAVVVIRAPSLSAAMILSGQMSQSLPTAAQILAL